jgi:hypothetical protein
MFGATALENVSAITFVFASANVAPNFIGSLIVGARPVRISDDGLMISIGVTNRRRSFYALPIEYLLPPCKDVRDIASDVRCPLVSIRRSRQAASERAPPMRL